MSEPINLGALSLLPPLIAIALALLTRQVFLSLLAGLWIGYVILAGGNPLMGSFETLNAFVNVFSEAGNCLLYTSPSPRDATLSRMPSSA